MITAVLADKTLLSLTAEWWAAIAVWVTLVPLSVFGVLQLRDAKRVRHEQTRPFVIADLRNRSVLAILAVVNIGPTVARRVRVRLPDGLRSAARQDLDWLESPLFGDGAAMLAPGQELRFWFDTFPKRKEAGLPLQIRVILEYEGPDGTSFGPEEFTLDLSAHGPALQPDKTMHELVEEVHKIGTEIGKWTDRGRIRVATQNADRLNARERRPMYFTKAREKQKEDGVSAAVRYLVQEWRTAVGLHEWR